MLSGRQGVPRQQQGPALRTGAPPSHYREGLNTTFSNAFTQSQTGLGFETPSGRTWRKPSKGFALSFSAHVRWCEHGAPVQGMKFTSSCQTGQGMIFRPALKTGRGYWKTLSVLGPPLLPGACWQSRGYSSRTCSSPGPWWWRAASVCPLLPDRRTGSGCADGRERGY